LLFLAFNSNPGIRIGENGRDSWSQDCNPYYAWTHKQLKEDWDECGLMTSKTGWVWTPIKKI